MKVSRNVVVASLLAAVLLASMVVQTTVCLWNIHLLTKRLDAVERRIDALAGAQPDAAPPATAPPVEPAGHAIPCMTYECGVREGIQPARLFGPPVDIDNVRVCPAGTVVGECSECPFHTHMLCDCLVDGKLVAVASRRIGAWAALVKEAP